MLQSVTNQSENDSRLNAAQLYTSGALRALIVCVTSVDEWMSAFRSALIFFKIPLSCDKAAVIYALQLQQLQRHFKNPSYV